MGRAIVGPRHADGTPEQSRRRIVLIFALSGRAQGRSRVTQTPAAIIGVGAGAVGGVAGMPGIGGIAAGAAASVGAGSESRIVLPAPAQRRLAAFDRAQHPPEVVVAGLQADDVAGVFVDEDADPLVLAGDRADQGESAHGWSAEAGPPGLAGGPAARRLREQGAGATAGTAAVRGYRQGLERDAPEPIAARLLRVPGTAMRGRTWSEVSEQ